MAKGNNQKPSNGSALDFEAQLWAAAQAVPASNCKNTEYNGAHPEGTLRSANTICSSRRMNGAGFSLSASNGERTPRTDSARVEPLNRSSRREEALTSFASVSMSLLTSAATRFREQAGVRCRIPRNADSFRADLHPDFKADLVPVRKDLATATRASANPTLAKPNCRSVGETELHPPFNLSDWGGENLRPELCL